MSRALRGVFSVCDGYDADLFAKALGKYGQARVTLPDGHWLQVGLAEDGAFEIHTSGCMSIEPCVTNSMTIKVGK
jgi:hypothetical protein